MPQKKSIDQNKIGNQYLAFEALVDDALRSGGRKAAMELHANASEYFNDEFEEDSASRLQALVLVRIEYFEARDLMPKEDKTLVSAPNHAPIVVRLKSNIEIDPKRLAELRAKNIFTINKDEIAFCEKILALQKELKIFNSRLATLVIKKRQQSSEQEISKYEEENEQFRTTLNESINAFYQSLGLENPRNNLEQDNRKLIFSDLEQIFAIFQASKLPLKEFLTFSPKHKLHIINNFDKAYSMYSLSSQPEFLTYLDLEMETSANPNDEQTTKRLAIFKILVLKFGAKLNIFELGDKIDTLYQLADAEKLSLILGETTGNTNRLLKVDADISRSLLEQAEDFSLLVDLHLLDLEDIFSIAPEKLKIILTAGLKKFFILTNYYFIIKEEVFALPNKDLSKLLNKPLIAADIFYPTIAFPDMIKVRDQVSNCVKQMKSHFEAFKQHERLMSLIDMSREPLKMARELRKSGLNFNQVHAIYEIVSKINSAYRITCLYETNFDYYNHDSKPDYFEFDLFLNYLPELTAIKSIIDDYYTTLQARLCIATPELPTIFSPLKMALEQEDYQESLRVLVEDLQLPALTENSIRKSHVQLYHFLRVLLKGSQQAQTHLMQAYVFIRDFVNLFTDAPQHYISNAAAIGEDKIFAAIFEREKVKLRALTIRLQDIYLSNSRGYSLLACATITNSHAIYNMVKAKIAEKSKLDIERFKRSNEFILCQQKETALSLAIKHDRFDIVLGLIANGEDIRQETNGKSPLQLAMENKGKNKSLIINELIIALQASPHLLATEPPICPNQRPPSPEV